MTSQAGQQLVSELLADPHGFSDQGRGHDLLLEYFEGFSLETLRPLLKHDDLLVRRVAAFVASELTGDKIRSLLPDTIPLLWSGDRTLQYHAMEIITSAGEAEPTEDFALVVQGLENDDDVLRDLAMRLLTRVTVSQLDAARRHFERKDERYRTHVRCLLRLIAPGQIDTTTAANMLREADPLVRRYGAIAAMRYFRHVSTLMEEIKSSHDPDLRRFGDEAVMSTQ